MPSRPCSPSRTTTAPSLHVANDAPALGETVPVFLRVPRADGAHRGVGAHHPRRRAAPARRATIDRHDGGRDLVALRRQVRNPVTRYRFLLDGGPRGYRWLNGTGVHHHDVTDATDFRLSAAPPPPAWARDAIVYQIFPDRFARSAGADGRPLPDWARPADWDDPVVRPGTGGAAALRRRPRRHHRAPRPHRRARRQHRLPDAVLPGARPTTATTPPPSTRSTRCSAATRRWPGSSEAVHARGLRLIGDLTTNHCGDTHAWFRRALEDAGSPEREFFYFPGPQDNGYESWLGHSSLPKLHFASAELRRRLLGGPRLDRRALAAATLRPGRLAGRRGQHDRPARHRRLQRRGGRDPAGDHGRGAAGRAAARRALPTTPPATWPATAGTAR